MFKVLSIWLLNIVVMKMNKRIELPIYEPIYKTYQYQGSGAAIIDNNNSIRNWYLNEIMLLKCTREFLKGAGSPKIDIVNSSLMDNPYLEKNKFPLSYLKGCTNQMIRNFIDLGYYVYFLDVDDYYIKNKSLYKERHVYHDGLICGYDKSNRTYCIYSHDSNWVYRKFWTPQICFTNGCKSSIKNNRTVNIFTIKAKTENVDFSLGKVYENLVEYLDSGIEKYPFDGEGDVFGIVVHTYIAEYIMKLFRGEISYSIADWRILRLIWEHKKAMLERIAKAEQILGLGGTLSERYKKLVKEADNIRMLYASHRIKRRDSALLIVCKKLLNIEAEEREILTEFLEKMKKELENEIVEVSQK